MSSKIDTALYDIGRLDSLAEGNTVLHRLDPRAKIIVTLVFIICVVSFDKYTISSLVPFFLFPAVIIGIANLPAGYLLKKLLIVSPFVLFIGIFNPFFDKEILMHLGPVGISGGWISFASLLLRFALTVGAALLLIATTGFPGICMGLEQLGAPRIFTVQLLMLYRYLFVLIEEGVRMVRAHALRSFGNKIRYRVFLQLLGNLLLRTLDRAQRIHMAMLSRAFTGEIKLIRQYAFGGREIVFTATCSALLLLFRNIHVADLLGRFILELNK